MHEKQSRITEMAISTMFMKDKLRGYESLLEGNGGYLDPSEARVPV
jgi:hypothetical protein